MRKISVTNNLTLDGVMQAPGRPDEDLRGGFPYGGWGVPYQAALQGKLLDAGSGREGALLFGRRTYENLFSVWPHRKDNPFTPVLDNTQKFVASRTLREPLPWKNSTLLSGDAVDAVARMKQERGPDLMILGSGELVRSLMARNLIDELVLLIHPLVLGTGRRMFADDASLTRFELVRSVPTNSGVVIATYRLALPAGQ